MVLRGSGRAAGSTGGLQVLTQVPPPAGGCFLCLHHPVCGASLGCHHGPHGGFLHQQNLLDPLRPPDALVSAAGSALHSLPVVSQLFQSALGVPWHEECRAGRAGALAHPREVPRAPKSPRCHQHLGSLKLVPVALAWPQLGLAGLSVTAPASSNLPATTLVFVPVVSAEPWQVAGPRWQPGQTAPQPRGGGMGVCVCGRSVVVADSHEGAPWAGRQLSWIWVPARGCSRRPREMAEGTWSRWDGLCEPPNGSCLHPGQI